MHFAFSIHAGNSCGVVVLNQTTHENNPALWTRRTAAVHRDNHSVDERRFAFMHHHVTRPVSGKPYRCCILRTVATASPRRGEATTVSPSNYYTNDTCSPAVVELPRITAVLKCLQIVFLNTNKKSLSIDIFIRWAQNLDFLFN